MKKQKRSSTSRHLSVIAALEMMAPVPALVAELDNTKTRYSLPLSEPPEIDGIIELDSESWSQAGGAAGNGGNWRVQVDDNLEDFIRGGELGAGEAPFDNEDLSFRIFVGNDDENLYVGVQLTDFDIFDDTAEAESENGQTWNDDSVEVFIDGDNSNFGERDTTGENPEVVDTGGQFVITLNNAYREAEAGNPGYGRDAAWYARADITDAGWDAEFRISLSAIGNPKPGDVIGFTIAVNDDDSGGNRDRQVVWVGSAHTESTYGNLVIGGKQLTAPKAPTPTIDGKLDDGEYAGAEAVLVNGATGVYNIPSGDDSWEEGDHEYTYWVTHDDDSIYVAVDVTDDQIFTDTAEAGSEDGQTWVDDSIEIFFDPDDSNDSGRGGGNFEGQYVFTANGARRDNEANNPTFGANADWFAATSETDKGYVIEFQVKKSALFDPTDGTTMGFNVALNDDDGNGRKAQLNWNGRPHSEFTYGSLTLGGAAEPSPGGGGSSVITGISVNNGTIRIEGSGTVGSAVDPAGPYQGSIALPADIPAEKAAEFFKAN